MSNFSLPEIFLPFYTQKKGKKMRRKMESEQKGKNKNKGYGVTGTVPEREPV